jgi:hypothetical protein
MHYRLLFILLIQGLLFQGVQAGQSTFSHYPLAHASSPMAKWVFLGSKTVDFGLDRDVVQVGYRDGSFKKIKIVVRGGGLNMHRCVVHFQNGSKEEIDLRHNFSKNSATRIIDLPGNRRFIDRIVFVYDSKNNQTRKSKVLVFGWQ